MTSTFQRFKHFLSLPTALILFLSASIGYFVVIDWISVIDVLDETTGYSYWYWYGYDVTCNITWDQCKEKAGYGWWFGYNLDETSPEDTSGGWIWWGTYIPWNIENGSDIVAPIVNETIVAENISNLFGLEDISLANVANFVAASPYNQEVTLAYLYAYAFGVTTMAIEDSRPEDGTRRDEFAKMLVTFATNVLDKQGDPTRTAMCSQYGDVDASLGDLAGYIVQACEMQLMGIDSQGNALESFDVATIIPRGQIVTTLGRLITNNAHDDVDPYYAGYMEEFLRKHIITINNPDITDPRQNVWIMLQRIHQRLATTGW